MKIAVVNFSGNVGKSTIARALLAPRIAGAQVYAVETINSDGTDDTSVKGREFADLHEALLTVDAAVVDVGASNIESALAVMKQYPGWADDYDFFVVPTAPAQKIQRDTISTIEALSAVGVPAKKILLVMNLVEVDEKPESIFSGLFEYQRQAKNFTLKPAAVLHVNDVFAKCRASGASIADLATDETDYKAAIRAAVTPDEKLQAAQMLGLQRLAVGVTAELDAVFKVLFGSK